jgi:hypothetical protein
MVDDGESKSGKRKGFTRPQMRQVTKTGCKTMEDKCKIPGYLWKDRSSKPSLCVKWHVTIEFLVALSKGIGLDS